MVHQDLERVFAQCWCSNGVSDAMWRIYSPSHLGVRIGTSTKKLKTALLAGASKRGITIRMEDVKYLSQHDLNLQIKSTHSSLKGNFDIERASDLLFMKREAYEHESEYRVVATCSSIPNGQVDDGLILQVDAKKIIDSILIDPRAPNELSEALIFYFKEKIGFKNKCQKSVLYKTPKSYVFE